MKTLRITINGKTDGDLENSLDEVKRVFETGCTSGFDANDTGNFTFSIEGEEEYPFSEGDRVRTLDSRMDGESLIKMGTEGVVLSRKENNASSYYYVLFGGTKLEYDESEVEYALEKVAL